MSNQNDSLLERVPQLLPSLAATAANLNKASKELGEVIERIDDALQGLNLGVTVWVTVHSENNLDKGGSEFLAEEIGYSRIGREWGLALSRREGDCGDYEPEEREVWPFNEAPRHLRIKAITKVPDLLKALDQAANEVAAQISASINETVPFVKVIEESLRPQRSIKKNHGRRL